MLTLYRQRHCHNALFPSCARNSLVQPHQTSKQIIKKPPPRRPVLFLRSELLYSIPIKFSTSRVDVNLMQLLGSSALPRIANDIEEGYYEDCKIGEEEVVGCHRSNGSIELRTPYQQLFVLEVVCLTYLCSENQEDQNQRQNGAPNTKRVSKGKFINSVSMIFPSLSEANVRKCNGAPREQRSQTR